MGLYALRGAVARAKTDLQARKKTGTAVTRTDIRDREPSEEFIKLICRDDASRKLRR